MIKLEVEFCFQK